MLSGNVEITVPGEAEHDDLIRQFCEAAWRWGWYDGHQEMKLKRQGRDFEDKPKLPDTGPAPTQAILWARRRTVLQGKWNRDLDGRVTQVIVHGLETGASNQEVMKALTQVFPTFSKARLENIVRTESMAAYNQGILASYKTNRFIVAVQFNAILDARTTAWCRGRDGLVMKLDDDRLPANTPPLHYQCRSVLTPMDEFDFEDLQNGDSKANRDWFSHVAGNGPKNLSQALAAWDSVPAAQAGFGSVPELEKAARQAQAAKPKPPQAPQPAPPAVVPPVVVTTPAPLSSPLPITLDDFADHGFGMVSARVVQRWNEFLPGVYPKDFFSFLGQDYSIAAIGFDANAKGFKFSLRFKHEASGEKGLMIREFINTKGVKSVEHAYFSVPKALQKDGLAKRMLAHTVGAYQDAGIHKITVHANIDVGSYAWARYGFRLRRINANRSFKTKLQSELRYLQGNGKPDEVAAATQLLGLNWGDDNPEILMSVAESILGKSLLMNEHWYGELKLQSYKHMETFWSYTDPLQAVDRLKPLRKKKR